MVQPNKPGRAGRERVHCWRTPSQQLECPCTAPILVLSRQQLDWLITITVEQANEPDESGSQQQPPGGQHTKLLEPDASDATLDPGFQPADLTSILGY